MGLQHGEWQWQLHLVLDSMLDTSWVKCERASSCSLPEKGILCKRRRACRQATTGGAWKRSFKSVPFYKGPHFHRAHTHTHTHVAPKTFLAYGMWQVHAWVADLQPCTLPRWGFRRGACVMSCAWVVHISVDMYYMSGQSHKALHHVSVVREVHYESPVGECSCVKWQQWA